MAGSAEHVIASETSRLAGERAEVAGSAGKDTYLSLRALAAPGAVKLAYDLDATNFRFGCDIAETGIVAGGIGAFRRAAACARGAMRTHVLNRRARTEYANSTVAGMVLGTSPA